MSLKARQELCDSVRERYRASAKKGKKKILDEFAAAAGYHRKHAIRVLNGEKAEKPVPVLRRNRPPRIYTPDVQEALETVWKAADRICSKRLAPYIGTFVRVARATRTSTSGSRNEASSPVDERCHDGSDTLRCSACGRTQASLVPERMSHAEGQDSCSHI